MNWLRTLYSRLSVALLLLVAGLAVVLLSVAHYTSDMYAQEVTQRLNQSIAMYITAERQLIEQGEVNQPAIDELAQRAMTINPTVEVYLLDPRGQVLTHVLGDGAVVRQRVGLAPIAEFLSGTVPLPIMGDDPRSASGKKVFSVSPITEGGEVTGYLYAVLGGAKYDSLRRAVEDSYILQLGALTITGAISIAALAGLAIFFLLTRRLVRLQRQVEAFRSPGPGNGIPIPFKPNPGDEIDELGNAFHAMAEHIQRQFAALQGLDATRRELIANVSHDLRTPLASMQGYIETLMIKADELTPETRREYLQIAFNHSQRLNGLIAELFELAKLDSGAIKPETETFSLTELVHDCIQEFGLTASTRQVELRIESDTENCYVAADIALIQRVLQNLIDNAITHTPAGHSVVVRISDSQDRALIEVSDTGRGIAQHEIPHIFERFYQSQQNESSDKIGAGLGLAIVRRILELHEATINVTSELGKGTSFRFELPLRPQLY